MKVKNLIGCALAVFAMCLAGCDSNPTNEPGVKEINDAVDKKMQAIDNDPNMTAEQKAEMKKHMAPGVGTSSARQDQDRK